jgi:hypothetical protein
MNTLITDQTLMMVFAGKRLKSARFEYYVIFQNQDHKDQLLFNNIYANNKIEATRMAREYGARFINARVVEVQKVGA